jgi:hypothetical protein
LKLAQSTEASLIAIKRIMEDEAKMKGARTFGAKMIRLYDVPIFYFIFVTNGF